MVTTNVTENQTHDILTDFYDEPVYVVCCVAMTTAVEVIGNGLLSTIIMYEKFGMDPQKRTAINQLLSKVCCMLILSNLTIFPFTVIRTLFGPQSELVVAWMFSGMNFCWLHNCLTLTAMMVLKCLYLFFWPRMAMLNDTLVAQSICQFNIMISCICTITRMYLGEYHTTPYFEFVTGQESFNDESDLSQIVRLRWALLTKLQKCCISKLPYFQYYGPSSGNLHDDYLIRKLCHFLEKNKKIFFYPSRATSTSTKSRV
jgi:hypothetical protein